jgi:hypothetical protein
LRARIEVARMCPFHLGGSMIVFSREVVVCRFATNVPVAEPSSVDDGARFRRGSVADFARLDRSDSSPTRLDEFERRLARGEAWLIGEIGSRIVTYTWIQQTAEFSYPYLPGCAFAMRRDAAYGYDAFTAPDLRALGLRRRAFVEELRWLAGLGKRWEVGVFIKPHLEGALRSLARAGIETTPLWRVVAGPHGLTFDRLCEDDVVHPLRLAEAAG